MKLPSAGCSRRECTPSKSLSMTQCPTMAVPRHCIAVGCDHMTTERLFAMNPACCITSYYRRTCVAYLYCMHLHTNAPCHARLHVPSSFTCNSPCKACKCKQFKQPQDVCRAMCSPRQAPCTEPHRRRGESRRERDGRWWRSGRGCGPQF